MPAALPWREGRRAGTAAALALNVARQYQEDGGHGLTRRRSMPSRATPRVTMRSGLVLASPVRQRAAAGPVFLMACRALSREMALIGTSSRLASSLSIRSPPSGTNSIGGPTGTLPTCPSPRAWARTVSRGGFVAANPIHGESTRYGSRRIVRLPAQTGRQPARRHRVGPGSDRCRRPFRQQALRICMLLRQLFDAYDGGLRHLLGNHVDHGGPGHTHASLRASTGILASFHMACHRRARGVRRHSALLGAADRRGWPGRCHEPTAATATDRLFRRQLHRRLTVPHIPSRREEPMSIAVIPSGSLAGRRRDQTDPPGRAVHLGTNRVGSGSRRSQRK